ncbi:MAG: type II toxin-antitoxin system HigB family toxin [Tagaea sp.]
MKILRFDRLTDLVVREKARNAKRGATLERRVAAFRRVVETAAWRNPADAKRVFGAADFVGGNRLVFDLCGNSYRVVAKVNYEIGVVELRFAGGHAEYDAIDARKV